MQIIICDSILKRNVRIQYVWNRIKLLHTCLIIFLRVAIVSIVCIQFNCTEVLMCVPVCFCCNFIYFVIIKKKTFSSENGLSLSDEIILMLEEPVT
jgi:hypothetical protein